MKNLIISVIILSFCFMDAGTNPARAQIPIQNSDAEILRIVANIDRNEIQMARLAEKKNIDPHVADYARMLDIDHNENLDRVRMLSQRLGVTLKNNGPIGQLRINGEQNILTLSPLDEDDFSREFIWEIIRGHSNVLTWIDSQDTQNSQVRSFLNETWEQIAGQLEKAQLIRERVLK